MKCLRFKPQTVRNAAFYFTLVESVSGLIATILCVLLYFCVFNVRCPEDPNQQILTILFTFYESYFIGPGCTVEKDVPFYRPNNSSFTRPEVIFYWQASSVALYLVWLSTAYVIYQTKPATVNSCVYWIIITIIISTIDIVFSVFIITDYKNLPAEVDVQNCPFESIQNTTTTTYNQNIATTILLLYSSKGGIFLIINIYLCLSVLSNLDEMKRLSKKTKSLNNEDITKTKAKPVYGKQVSEQSSRGSYLDKIGRPTLPEGTSYADIYNRRSRQPVDNDLDTAFDFLDSYPENRRNDPMGVEGTSNGIRRYDNGEIDQTKNVMGRYSYEPPKADTRGRRMEGLANDELEERKERQSDAPFSIPRVKVPVVARTLSMHKGNPGIDHQKDRKKSVENKERKQSSGSGNQQKGADYGPRRYFIPLKD